MKPANSIFMSGMCSAISKQAILALVCVILAVGCSNFEKQSNIGPTTERLGSRGYLPMEALPDSVALIPPPPAEGTASFALDEEVSRKSLALRGTPRWELATKDASTWFPDPVNAFSCALNIPITENETPHLYTLLFRTFDDVDFSDSPAKHLYKRPKPFVLNKEPRCTRVSMKKYTGYPSFSAALGWAWALILSEIAPERSDEILARGRAYGQSDVICNVTWQSSVTEGRHLGAAVVARLHSIPEFRVAIDAAKLEITALQMKGISPERDCDAEAAALSFSLKSAP